MRKFIVLLIVLSYVTIKVSNEIKPRLLIAKSAPTCITTKQFLITMMTDVIDHAQSFLLACLLLCLYFKHSIAMVLARQL